MPSKNGTIWTSAFHSVDNNWLCFGRKQGNTNDSRLERRYTKLHPYVPVIAARHNTLTECKRCQIKSKDIGACSQKPGPENIYCKTLRKWLLAARTKSQQNCPTAICYNWDHSSTNAKTLRKAVLQGECRGQFTLDAGDEGTGLIDPHWRAEHASQQPARRESTRKGWRSSGIIKCRRSTLLASM